MTQMLKVSDSLEPGQLVERWWTRQVLQAGKEPVQTRGDESCKARTWMFE